MFVSLTICVDFVFCVLPYVWSSLSPYCCLMVIHLPAICHQAFWSHWQWPHCTVVHMSSWPSWQPWPCLSPWPGPHRVPVALSVTKWLMRTNPSCHSRQQLVANRSVCLYDPRSYPVCTTHRPPTHTQPATGSPHHIKLTERASFTSSGVTQSIKDR